ncbi:MAG: tetratricopeptide repeat protein, partial [bacterium]
AYLNNKDLRKALNQFTRIVKENPDNASYLFNLAMTYKEKGHTDKAKKYLKKSYEVDNINPDTVLELSHIYYDQGDKEKAINLLREAIEADGVIDFQDFIFFFSIVELHIASGNIDQAESVLNEVEDIIPEDQDSRSYVGWKFGNLAVTLFDLKAYDLAEKISGWALKFDPDNQNLSDIKLASGDLKRLFSSYQKLETDDQVIEPLKGPFYFYLYSNDGSVSDEEWENYQKKVFQAIDSYIKNQPDMVVNSISRIKRSYYELFKINEDITKFYKDILKDAREQKEFFDQIQAFQNDNNIIDEFKGFLSLWLSQEYTESERERYSKNIFDKLDYYIQMENENKIISSIRRIKIKYQKIYQLNQKFFDNIHQEIKNIKIERSNSSNNYNSNSSSSNHNSSNNKSNTNHSTINKSYNSYNNSNKSNDSDGGSGCGCLLLIIIAVIFLL